MRYSIAQPSLTTRYSRRVTPSDSVGELGARQRDPALRRGTGEDASSACIHGRRLRADGGGRGRGAGATRPRESPTGAPRWSPAAISPTRRRTGSPSERHPSSRRARGSRQWWSPRSQCANRAGGTPRSGQGAQHCGLEACWHLHAPDLSRRHARFRKAAGRLRARGAHADDPGRRDGQAAPRAGQR